jgi:hypothetical protein
MSFNLLYIPLNNIKGNIIIDPRDDAFLTYWKKDPTKNPKLLPVAPIRIIIRTK